MNRELNTKKFRVLPVELISLIGAKETLLLIDLIDKDRTLSKQGAYDGWFYKNRAWIIADTGIKNSTQKEYIKKMESMLFLSVKREENCTWYKVNYIEINKRIDEQNQRFGTQKPATPLPENTDHHNKHINTTNTNSTINSTANAFSCEKTKTLSHLSKHEFNTYIPLFRKWNSYSEFRKIRLPKDYDDNCSKTIKDTIKLIKLLLNGEIHIHASNGLKSKKIYGMMEIEKSFKHLQHAINGGKFRDPLSLKDYIKSYKSGFSWFISFMEEPPEKSEIVKKEPQTPIKTAIIEPYIKLTGVSTSKGRQGIETQLHRLRREYVQIEKNIGLVYSKWNTGYQLHFQTFTSFCDTHVAYLKTYKEVGIGHLACGKKEDVFRPIWNKFIDFCKAEHGVNLYPIAKDVIRMKRNKWLVKEAGKKPDDFKGGYLKEDWKLLDDGRYKL